MSFAPPRYVLKTKQLTEVVAVSRPFSALLSAWFKNL
jgi:hypothetical protein